MIGPKLGELYVHQTIEIGYKACSQNKISTLPLFQDKGFRHPHVQTAKAHFYAIYVWKTFYCHEIPQLFCYHTTLQTLLKMHTLHIA